jgi:Cohesin domain
MAFWQVMTARAARLCGVLAVAGAASLPAAAQTVSVNATGPAVPGSSVTLQVLINGIVDLYAFQFSLSFNPAVLQATGVTEGAFLPAGGGTTFDDGTIDNALGKVSLVFDSLSGFVPGVSGNGVLASMNFNVIAAGTSPLTFSDLLFLNSQLADITVTGQNGSVVAVPEPQAVLLMAVGVAALLAHRRRAAAANA